MKVIITSGGTKERVDDVRVIANRSTGGLGACIAETMYAADNTAEIIYICSTDAIKPTTRATIIQVESAKDAYNALEAYRGGDIDCVIHAMAVSDYTLHSISDGTNQINSASKIPSTSDTLTLTLVRTKKIIDQFPKWFPNAWKVSFKLLSGVSTEQLIKVAQEQRKRTNSHYVVVNDLKGVGSVQHRAHLVGEQLTETYTTKDMIAKAIVRKYMEEIYHD